MPGMFMNSKASCVTAMSPPHFSAYCRTDQHVNAREETPDQDLQTTLERRQSNGTHKNVSGLMSIAALLSQGSYHVAQPAQLHVDENRRSRAQKIRQVE